MDKIIWDAKKNQRDKAAWHIFHGVRGCQERGTSFKYFNSNTEQRSLETGTHTQGMTLRLDTEAGKHRALKGETKLGNW